MNIIPRIDNKKLPGELWLLTTFFNPAKYTNKLTIFKRFYDRAHQQGAHVLIIELAASEQDLEVRPIVYPNDIYVPIIQQNAIGLWQKERMLNIGMQHLPSNCDKVMWIDADVLFHSDDWIERLSLALEKYVVVQPFEYAIKLSPKEIFVGLDKTPWGHDCESCSVKNNSFIGALLKYGMVSADARVYESWGHPGFCCAYRRELIDKHGFFDLRPDGANDTLIIFASIGQVENVEFLSDIGVEQEYAKWRTDFFKDILMSFNYTTDIISHVYHGPNSLRQYHERKAVLRNNGFSARKHLIVQPGQLLEWSELAPLRLRTFMNNHFKTRKENG